MTTAAIDSLTICLPRPSAERLATVLSAVTGAKMTTVPATVSDASGQIYTIQLGGTRVQIVEGQAPAAAPEQLALQVPDPAEALAWLSGFGVTETPGDERVAGHVSISGVRLLILTAP